MNWAQQANVKWLFTNCNAASAYCTMYNDIVDLKKLNWAAISETQWQLVRDEKQSEFLWGAFFPLNLFESIGVFSSQVAEEIQRILQARNLANMPSVVVHRDWYY